MGKTGFSQGKANQGGSMSNNKEVTIFGLKLKVRKTILMLAAFPVLLLAFPLVSGCGCGKQGTDKLLFRHHDECEEFIAVDDSVLSEYLHPDKDPLALRYSVAHAVVAPGQTTAPHRLEGASEVYIILEGEGLMSIEDESEPVRAGHTIYIPPGALQCIENTGSADLEFLCIVDPAWQPEHEEGP